MAFFWKEASHGNGNWRLETAALPEDILTHKLSTAYDVVAASATVHEVTSGASAAATWDVRQVPNIAGAWLSLPQYCWQDAAGKVPAVADSTVMRRDNLISNTPQFWLVDAEKPTLKTAGGLWWLEWGSGKAVGTTSVGGAVINEVNVVPAAMYAAMKRGAGSPTQQNIFSFSQANDYLQITTQSSNRVAANARASTDAVATHAASSANNAYEDADGAVVVSARFRLTAGGNHEVFANRADTGTVASDFATSFTNTSETRVVSGPVFESVGCRDYGLVYVRAIPSSGDEDEIEDMLAALCGVTL